MIVKLYDREIDLGPKPSGLCRQRWLGQLSPEPETVRWIESLPAGDLFFDIGASMGTHAVRADLRGLYVTAFEPHETYFEEMYGIVKRNQLIVSCQKLALMDVSGLGYLVRGRSKHTFMPSMGGEVLATTLDQYVEHSGLMPDHIKLDVDGNEAQIIRGGQKTFRKLKTALIEVDPLVPGHRTIPELMTDLGFTWDAAQVAACMYKEGKYKGTANYIFRRK